MPRSQSGSAIALIPALFCCTILSADIHAAEQRAATATSSAQRPLAQTSLALNSREPGNVSVSDLHASNGIQVIDPICVEINQIAQNEGRRPVGSCNPNRGINTNLVVQPPADPPADQAPLVETELRPVLFVHGFHPAAVIFAHNCNNAYWGPQKSAVEDLGRSARTIGWYSNNADCDDDLYTHGEHGNYSSNTPIATVAEDLFRHIQATYIDNRDIPQAVDIVAHSLGGLVVRKMLDDWGDQLYVRNVVTLATPHDGVKEDLIGWVCLLWEQCAQSSEDSDFIQALEHNPQSIIETKWTLIAAADDNIIGQNTATGMYQGSSSRPSVTKYTYKSNEKHDCDENTPSLGHGDVHDTNGTKTVYTCDGENYTDDLVKNPTTQMLDALLL